MARTATIFGFLAVHRPVHTARTSVHSVRSVHSVHSRSGPQNPSLKQCLREISRLVRPFELPRSGNDGRP